MSQPDELQPVRDRLALIESGITGFSANTTYAQGPFSLPEGDLPIIVNFAGPATYDWGQMTPDAGVEHRIFFVRMYCIPRGQDGYPGDAEKFISPLIWPVVTQLISYPTLNRLPTVRKAVLMKDSGVAEIFYAGTAFLGVQFDVQVDRTILRKFAQGE